MGTTTNKPEEKNQQAPKIKHPRLVKAEHHKNQYGAFLELHCSISNKQLFQNWQEHVEQYAKYQQIESMYLPQMFEFKSEGLCGSAGVVRVRYEVLPFLLSQEIENRKEIHRPFMQNEMWYLVYSLVFTGYKLHSDNCIIGDVRPQNIFISEDGEIKISTMYTFFEDDMNYNKTQLQKEITYLSPEEMKDLQSGKEKPTGHQGTSQSFSVGLTILSAMNLKDYSYFYGKDFSFKDYEYQKQVKNIRALNNYSSLLKKVTEGLCRKNPTDRLNCSEVVQLLKSEEDKILNLEEFQLVSIPPGIKNKLELGNNYQQTVKPARTSVTFNHQPTPLYVPYNDSQRHSHPQVLPYSFGQMQQSSRVIQKRESVKVKASFEYGMPSQTQNTQRGGQTRIPSTNRSMQNYTARESIEFGRKPEGKQKNMRQLAQSTDRLGQQKQIVIKVSQNQSSSFPQKPKSQDKPILTIKPVTPISTKKH